MRCLACNYELKHLAEPRCPECGRAFDPKDLHSFEWGQSQRTAWDQLKPLGWFGVVLAISALFLILAVVLGYLSMNTVTQ